MFFTGLLNLFTTLQQFTTKISNQPKTLEMFFMMEWPKIPPQSSLTSSQEFCRIMPLLYDTFDVRNNIILYIKKTRLCRPNTKHHSLMYVHQIFRCVCFYEWFWSWSWLQLNELSVCNRRWRRIHSITLSTCRLRAN